MTAPVAPFYSDRLYQDLTENTAGEKSASVHLSTFPKANPNAIILTWKIVSIKPEILPRGTVT